MGLVPNPRPTRKSGGGKVNNVISSSARGPGKRVQKVAGGIVVGENFAGRKVPRGKLSDQRAKVTTRALRRGRVAGV